MILIAYGTRPEFIKIKPLMVELKNRNLPFKILFTGQHEDIAHKNYDYNINLNEESENRLNSIIINCLKIPEFIFNDITHILVQGDTTSALGLSLTAMNRKIEVIHLEAGLRSYDVYNPYPEEYNRKIISSIAKFHLCPTYINQYNLNKEGIHKNIFIVGNTSLDNLLKHKEKCEYSKKILVTMHRRENHNELHDWFKEINKLALKNKDIEFIIPLHPNPNVQKYKYLLKNLTILDSLPHDKLLDILCKCMMVITDSGGLQEECSFLNKKCLVCRKVTERPEALNKSSFIVETPNKLDFIFHHHLNNFKVNLKSPYGDGNSSEKIVNILENNIY